MYLRVLCGKFGTPPDIRLLRTELSELIKKIFLNIQISQLSVFKVRETSSNFVVICHTKIS